MTNKKAIEIIKSLPAYRAELIYGSNSDLAKALSMAIEALENKDETKKDNK